MSNLPFEDCLLFTQQMKEKTKKEFPRDINYEFITRMINDELKELKEAKDDAEFVDALLDISYYILQHLGTTKINVSEEWKNKFIIPLEFDLLKEKFFQPCTQSSFFLNKDKELVFGLIESILREKNSDHSDCSKLLSVLNFCLTFPYTKGIDIKQIWKLIHTANMTKFGNGGKLENGKWIKPADFIPPDSDIRKEIVFQLPKFF